MKTLSIITINYNNADGLNLTIKSVLEQTFANYEFIIIDGGSDDKSREVINKYKGRLAYWISEKDNGIYHAMNKGILAANGDYCLFLNSGDYLCKDVLSNIFRNDYKADILYCPLIFDFGNGRREIKSLPEKLSLFHLYNDNIWHPASFIKRILFLEQGMYDESFRIAGDYDFFFRSIIKFGASTQYINEPVAVYDTSGVSSISHNYFQIELERSTVHKKYLTPKQLYQLKVQKKIKNKFLRNLIQSSALFAKLYQLIYRIYFFTRYHSTPSFEVRKITFFTPSLNRTGSEIVLFNLLNTLLPLWDVNVVSSVNGSLASRLPEYFFYKYLKINKYHLRVRHYINKLRKNTLYPFLLNQRQSSIWYINTIALPDILQEAEQRKVTTWLHVHELQQMFETLTPEQEKRIINYPDLIIANSNTTAYLLKSKGRTGNIKIIYPAINTELIKKNKQIFNQYRKNTGFDEKDFLWIMAGTVDQNKNPLFFIEIAKLLISKFPQTKFLWLGSISDEALFITCLTRIKMLDLGAAVKFINPAGDEFQNYLQTADGFVLTSTIESFSIVTVEALLLGLPVVATDCGGVKEILIENTGKIVKGHENTEGMVAEMILYQTGEYPIDSAALHKYAKKYDISYAQETWNKLLIEEYESGKSKMIKIA